MRNTLKLVLTAFIILFSISNSSNAYNLTMPWNNSKKSASNIVFIFWKEMPNYSDKYVSVRNLWKEWIWFFYSQPNYEYCIVDSVRYEKCKSIRWAKWYLYLENNKYYYKEELKKSWPYSSEEEINNDLKNISNSYIEFNKKFDNKHDSYESFETDEWYFLKHWWVTYWPQKWYKVITKDTFSIKLEDWEYWFIDWKLIWPYNKVLLYDFWENWTLMRYLKDWDWNTWNRFQTIWWKTYKYIRNSEENIEFINLGENWVWKRYKENNNEYLEVNWKVYWPYENIRDIINLKKSWIWISYRNDSGTYIEVQWKTYWPLNLKRDYILESLWDNWFYFTYDKEENKYNDSYVNINWEVYWPYSRISRVSDFKENWILVKYKDYNQSNAWKEVYKTFIINSDKIVNKKTYNIKPVLKNKIDSLISKSSTTKLNKLNYQLSKIDLNNKKYAKYKDILEYLKESIDEKLNK